MLDCIHYSPVKHGWVMQMETRVGMASVDVLGFISFSPTYGVRTNRARSAVGWAERIM